MTTYSDLSLTLKAHPYSKDVLKKLDVDAVKASMKLILLGAPFDIPFNPNYGANLRGLLFEQLTPSTAAVAKRKILLSLSEYEPRCVVEDLYIGEDDQGGINIGILFHVTGSTAQQTLNFVLERVR